MAVKRNSFVETLRKPYFTIRNHPFIYKNVINKEFKYSLSELTSLNSKQKHTVNKLQSNGIAVIDFTELFSQDEFNVLTSWIDLNEKNLVQRSKKKYLYSYYGTEDYSKKLDLDNPFVRFYLSDTLLQIAIAYLGYIPSLYEVYIEKTVPVGKSLPTQSQNWHRDPEEKKTLKIFLYMNDVTIESGPFTYILGSHPTSKSKISNLFPQNLPHGSYPDASEIKKIVDNKLQYQAIAPRGTLIFCDTAGIHKGGHAISDERVMSTGFYPSKKYSMKPLYNVSDLTNNEIIESKLGKLALKVLGVE